MIRQDRAILAGQRPVVDDGDAAAREAAVAEAAE
jgi:hypothetical protein